MSSTRTMPTKARALAQMQALIDGLQKHYPNETFTFGNATYTTQELVTLFQRLIDSIRAVNDAQASTRDLVQAMRGMEAQVDPVFMGLKRNLQNRYGTAAQMLAEFGLVPVKAPAPRTAEQNVAAKAKAAATREARGTASKKRKAAIKGNVTGITVTPVTVTTEEKKLGPAK